MDKKLSINRKKSGEGTIKPRICPSCGEEYTAHPALSRKDGKTKVCPDCGIREALFSFGLGKKEVEEGIIEIHRLEGTKIDRTAVNEIKAEYPKGTRIVLDNMADPYPVEDGTIGEVDYVDDAGQIHVSWEAGRELALIPGVDEFHKV